eukprot:CAMPEP_0172321342 /NCGR_PEP_ID=MMETSP1058-20130122/43119_1 /TAXON_ID=83371 /ORGANISM="Detonula confervacea, Strain CCMP 353" /LENGTH=283 /DNA_ID=CAMNT_0013036823 /DNA_START=145 /DNA_END=996 /DNA_ORIENTATION=+
MTEDADNIKTMKLYTNVDRIKNELASRDMFKGEIAIDPIALSEIDSMHYLGNIAIEDAVVEMKLDSSSTVLDIGSGFGGPARVLSSLSKCTTTALELQTDIHQMAEYLTKRCNLENHLKHELGDILTFNLDELGGGLSSFDGIVSFLVFLHIPDKKSLLENCAKMLKSGGTIFFEDFYCRSQFSEAEVNSLAEDVYANDLPTREEYISHLETSGFHNIQVIDKSSEWTAYVSERLEKFTANRYKFEEVHGEPTYLSLLHFYNAIVKLFTGQSLGGVRVVAEKL